MYVRMAVVIAAAGVALWATVFQTGDLSARTGEAEAIVQSIIDTGMDVLREDKSDAELLDALDRVMSEHMADAQVSRFVLGRHVRGMSPLQIERFTEAFHDHLINFFASSLNRYGRHPIEITGTKVSGERIVVESLVSYEPEDIAIGWRFQTVGGDLKIVDVMVEGISLAITKRSEFDSYIDRHSVEDLIQRLEGGQA